MPDFYERIESLRGAVQYGCIEGKRNMIVDMGDLEAVFRHIDTLSQERQEARSIAKEFWEWQRDIPNLLPEALEQRVYQAGIDVEPDNTPP